MALLAQSNLGTWAVVAFVLLLAFYFLILLPRRIRGREGSSAPVRTQGDREAGVPLAHRLLARAEELEVRMLETSREIDARTENKIALLRGLTEEVEERTLELRALLDFLAARSSDAPAASRELGSLAREGASPETAAERLRIPVDSARALLRLFRPAPPPGSAPSADAGGT
ncbi:MAG: hypothetical protein HY720_06795 [Planctomycetes bacterium]|nr:hypothetical protein [Planctomycetota bacterium]